MGTAPALQTVLALGVDTIHRNDVGLSDRFRDGLELPRTGSAIVSIAASDARMAALDAAGVRVSGELVGYGRRSTSRPTKLTWTPPSPYFASTEVPTSSDPEPITGQAFYVPASRARTSSKAASA